MKRFCQPFLLFLWLVLCCAQGFAQQMPLVPSAIAFHGDKMLLGTTAFDGRGELRCTDKMGRTLWRADFNTFDVAIGPRYVYALGSGAKGIAVRRYDLLSGQQAPFAALSEAVLPVDSPTYSNTFTYGGGRLHVLLVSGETAHKAYRVDAESGEVTEMDKKGPLRAVTAVQKPNGDVLFILLADGSVIRDDLALNPRAPQKLFALKGVLNPVRLAVSADEKRFAISDYGRQVWLVDAKGNPLSARTEPKTGTFWPLGLNFDRVGNLWLAEAAGGFWNWSRGTKIEISKPQNVK